MKIKHRKFIAVIAYFLIYLITFNISYEIFNRSNHNKFQNISDFTEDLLEDELLKDEPASNTIRERFKLGNEVLLDRYQDLIKYKKVGLITNQTGVNSKGESLINILSTLDNVKLAALYAPEHGIDGKAKAGAYVKSYMEPNLNIPVYSLYGDTRKPTKDMLQGLDVLIFDIQDLGVRTYTYISTLYYCMEAAAKENIKILVLDRPNPLGGNLVEGPVLEEKYRSFVGIDTVPMIHGMTIGEMANYFNRIIEADLKVIPMEGYKRDMIFQDTGMKWVQSSPNIPNINSVFLYCASGLGEGTNITMKDFFSWVGGPNVNSLKFAELLNNTSLEGVYFKAWDMGNLGGVKIEIKDYRKINPMKIGLNVLYYAKVLSDFKVPKSQDNNVVMFDKIMGTNKIGELLEKGFTAKDIESYYQKDLENFKRERIKYLIYK